MNNCSIVLREDITDDQLIDVIEGSKKYVPGLVVLNKIDMVSKEELERVKAIVQPDICISAEMKLNTEELKALIFKKLEFIRIYCKEHGKKADMSVPLIMRNGNNLRDVCIKLHKDFASKFRFARIWGTSARFPGMPIRRLDFEVHDKDVAEIHVS